MADIRIEICYARPEVQILKSVTVPEGASLKVAIETSGVLEAAPEIDLASSRVGVFGKLKGLDTVVRDHDRVEIYRSLIADPKESRRKRAVKKNEKKAG